MSTTPENDLEDKLREWFERPEIKAAGWSPRLFWQPAGPNNPYGELRVDPFELEVFFAAMLGEVSACSAELENRQPQRAVFLAANARRHELPLFTRR